MLLRWQTGLFVFTGILFEADGENNLYFIKKSFVNNILSLNGNAVKVNTLFSKQHSHSIYQLLRNLCISEKLIMINVMYYIIIIL